MFARLMATKAAIAAKSTGTEVPNSGMGTYLANSGAIPDKL